jgi:uncharacterized protein (DUF58 family)
VHLAQRAYALILLTAMLAIAGVWSSEPAFGDLWRIPAAVLLIGIAYEGFSVRKVALRVKLETAAHALLGRGQPAAFVFASGSPRELTIEYAPVLPAGFEPLPDVRTVCAPAGGEGVDPFVLQPVRLGLQSWPALHARLRGPLGLAWWSRELQLSRELKIAPDTLGVSTAQPRGNAVGARPRRVVGAGSELHQLRGYLRGDPLARIDWKATARAGELVTREFSEDQHLDILVAVDAGRFSRVRAGRLDRFGLYANVAARFAETVTPNDDRIGLVVFSDRILTACAPARGLSAVTRVRRALEPLSAEPAESDPIVAAARIRGMLKHRGLIVFLTDLDETVVTDQLVRAVRALSPPHFVVVAGVRGPEISQLARSDASDWSDPWVALAAREHERRAEAQQQLLKRLGVSVVTARHDLLESAVLLEYERLRRSRRV